MPTLKSLPRPAQLKQQSKTQSWLFVITIMRFFCMKQWYETSERSSSRKRNEKEKHFLYRSHHTDG